MDFSKRFILIALLFAISSCQEKVVVGGEVIIRNDILDKEYNSFVVDEVITAAGLSGYSRIVKPTEIASIPYKHIRSIRFTRQYKDHAKVYIVHCPENLNSSITVKLIDVHTNRLPGGCVLSKKGERSLNGVTTWQR